jgi:two-component system NtrC family sensor kinase
MRGMEKDIPKDLKFRYRRFWIFSIALMCLVALAPLIIMTFTNYYQYEEVFTEEFTHQITRRIYNTKQTMEDFIRERISILSFLNREKSFTELCNPRECTFLLSNLKKSFEGFIDLGVIDSKGTHRSYSGPYELGEKNYKDQQWFQEVSLKGIHVSDVFMGFRKFPHFVIAIKHELENGDFYILRATLSTDILNDKIHSLEFRGQSDVFLINREGILQTPSHVYGNILEACSLPIPPYTPNVMVKQEYDQQGNTNIFGYAYIEKSPFILIVTKHSEDYLANLFKLRTSSRRILIFSILLIVIVILSSTAYMVRQVYKSDITQAKVLHDMEYTNKMASIGRLAAGVAHEINNPLAIINEKAGLLKDFATLKPDFTYKDKILDNVNSILKSVDRCSTITHRLLGFAKRMDINTEVIDLELLLKEVTSFLEKDALFRNITINYKIDDNLPSIESDRGQLQQVFLNIITNAFYAVKDNGKIDISIIQKDSNQVEIAVADNGVGISKENLEHIFEPFYTTKGKYGTGLGLSITYGIIAKLGGLISVKSKLGEGTSFTVCLPVKSKSF